MKVVINRQYGGFSVSREAMEFMASNGNAIAQEALSDAAPDETDFWEFTDDSLRSDPDLVAAVETLGAKADGVCASLKIVDIPDGVSWVVGEYDGMEYVTEIHRIWK